MKLTKVYVRNFPPGIVLESLGNQDERSRHEVDLINLHQFSKPEPFVKEILEKYPWTCRHKDHVTRVINRLIAHIGKSTANKFKLSKILKSHQLMLTHSALSRDATLCLSGSYDRTAKVWCLITGSCLATLTGHQDAVYDVTFLGKNENMIATGSLDQDIRIWKVSDSTAQNSTSPAVTCELILKKHSGPISALKSCQLNSNDDVLLSASLDHTAILWDLEMGDATGVFKGHEGVVSGVSLARNKSFIHTISFDGTARLWDPRTFKQSSIFSHEYCQVNSCSLDWTDRFLATALTDSRAVLWDIRNNKYPIDTFYHDAEVVHVTFDRKGQLLATSSMDGTCHLVNVRSLDDKITLRKHSGEVTMAEFDATGNRILTAGSDGKVILWDTEDGLILQICAAHEQPIHSLNISYDGKSFLTAGMDAKCCFWKAVD